MTRKNTTKGWFPKEATTSSPPKEVHADSSPPEEVQVDSSPPRVVKKDVCKLTPKKKI
jgi:hypothetical protein